MVTDLIIPQGSNPAGILCFIWPPNLRRTASPLSVDTVPLSYVRDCARDLPSAQVSLLLRYRPANSLVLFKHLLKFRCFLCDEGHTVLNFTVNNAPSPLPCSKFSFPRIPETCSLLSYYLYPSARMKAPWWRGCGISQIPKVPDTEYVLPR